MIRTLTLALGILGLMTGLAQAQANGQLFGKLSSIYTTKIYIETCKIDVETKIIDRMVADAARYANQLGMQPDLAAQSYDILKTDFESDTSGCENSSSAFATAKATLAAYGVLLK